MSTNKYKLVEAKLKEIYDDLAANVTHIYNRQDLHLAIDLVYHSPLRFNYKHHLVRKGYPEILIIGDTRTGKSQCAESLHSHYGLGVLASGEACSFSGLIGGLQQLNKTWTCTWGLIPQNNRRLVIIDEASGLKPEDIANMSTVRSQGMAKITKIQTQETEAWTRMLWLSNPRDQLTVNQFSSGVDIVESLCPAPEDIARWDYILIVSKDEIGYDTMVNTDSVPHQFTTQRCKNLIMWSWTREANEIHITDEAFDAVYSLAQKMVKKYCSNFTLVNPAEQRTKILRMAIALAARLFNTPDGHTLHVDTEHVEYIYDLMQRTYDSRYFKYDAWSINETKGMNLRNPDLVVEVCRSFGANGCAKFSSMNLIRCRDIEEYLGITNDEAKCKMSTLLLNNALLRYRGDYCKKSPEFQDLLVKSSKELTDQIQEF